MMRDFITPPDVALFVLLVGIAMVLTGLEIGGAAVIAASLGAFIFFEWWLYHRKPQIEAKSQASSNEIQRMIYAAEQWEQAIIKREKELDEREEQLRQREQALLVNQLRN